MQSDRRAARIFPTAESPQKSHLPCCKYYFRLPMHQKGGGLHLTRPVLLLWLLLSGHDPPAAAQAQGRGGAIKKEEEEGVPHAAAIAKSTSTSSHARQPGALQ